MFKKIFALVILMTLFTSCVSTKVSLQNNFDFSVLKSKSKYIVDTKDGNKIRSFEYLDQNETQLIGKLEEKNLNIEKTNITKIAKFSAGKTVPLLVGIVAAAIVIPAYSKNKPVGQ
ncbi:hypothetical protein [Halpernia frigidisoli]|uniref:Lipoprotein n=1 Tax=Halpernia frigidisoli TaxID=1125876 RepID=A0A1I3FK48_9FLAO|nr:hypothetical protein [Halpernia frigidisoli]SFI11554.1 hypothetical protein SAMN05443292_1431 [Halpernia frigidisoli]